MHTTISETTAGELSAIEFLNQKIKNLANNSLAVNIVADQATGEEDKNKVFISNVDKGYFVVQSEGTRYLVYNDGDSYDLLKKSVLACKGKLNDIAVPWSSEDMATATFVEKINYQKLVNEQKKEELVNSIVIAKIRQLPIIEALKNDLENLYEGLSLYSSKPEFRTEAEEQKRNILIETFARNLLSSKVSATDKNEFDSLFILAESVDGQNWFGDKSNYLAYLNEPSRIVSLIERYIFEPIIVSAQEKLNKNKKRPTY